MVSKEGDNRAIVMCAPCRWDRDDDPVYHDQTAVPCEGCRQMVWLAKSSQDTIASMKERGYLPEVRCAVCVLPEIKSMDQFMPLGDAQLEEISKYMSKEDVEELIRRFGRSGQHG